MTTTESFAWESDGVRWRADYDVIGNGPDALLLPALSSVSARAEMHPLARLLQARYRCIVPDWPGFGAVRGPDRRLRPCSWIFCGISSVGSSDTPRLLLPPVTAPPT